jgi:hypothetical protein
MGLEADTIVLVVDMEEAWATCQGINFSLDKIHIYAMCDMVNFSFFTNCIQNVRRHGWYDGWYDGKNEFSKYGYRTSWTWHTGENKNLTKKRRGDALWL